MRGDSALRFPPRLARTHRKASPVGDHTCGAHHEDAMDGGGESATREDRARLVAHEGRETTDGSTIGRERDCEPYILCLEQIQHRIWMGLGRSENCLAENLCSFEILPFGRVCTPEVGVFEELIPDVGEAVLSCHPKERRKHGELRNLVSRREPGHKSDSSQKPHKSKRKPTPVCRSSLIGSRNLRRSLGL